MPSLLSLNCRENTFSNIHYLKLHKWLFDTENTLPYEPGWGTCLAWFVSPVSYFTAMDNRSWQDRVGEPLDYYSSLTPPFSTILSTSCRTISHRLQTAADRHGVFDVRASTCPVSTIKGFFSITYRVITDRFNGLCFQYSLGRITNHVPSQVIHI